MTQTTALIGASAMGGAIGARLAATGTVLAVFDLDPARLAPLTALGAQAAASAAEAARGAQAVIVSLNAPISSTPPSLAPTAERRARRPAR